MPNKNTQDIEFLIGDCIYITPRRLVELQVFGSMSAVRIALKKGVLPFIQPSPRRRLIAKSDLLNFLNKNKRRV